MRELAIQNANSQILAAALDAIKGTDDLQKLEDKIIEIESAHCLSLEHRRALLIDAWEKSVNGFLEDGILEASEERRLVAFKSHFGLSQGDLDRNGSLTKTAKAAALRELLEGKVPEHCSVTAHLPINLQKGEKIVWAFPRSKYLEDKTLRQYVGGSHGVSIRVMKGVYYRIGAFKGHSVETTGRVHVDTGWVVLTDKNIYFAGPRKSLRVPYAKIVSFEPFSDGVGIVRDATNAKPQIFITGDGWFTYNLVINLSQLHVASS